MSLCAHACKCAGYSFPCSSSRWWHDSCGQDLRFKLGAGVQPDFIQLLVDPLHHGNYIEMVHTSWLQWEDASSDTIHDVTCPSLLDSTHGA